MISSIAVPSSQTTKLAHGAGGPMTFTGPRSPAAWLAARLRTPSERTPILIPAPVVLYAARAATARCVMSPSELRLPRPVGPGMTLDRWPLAAVTPLMERASADRSPGFADGRT